MALPWRPTKGAAVVLAPVTKTACVACYQQRTGVVVAIATAGVTVQLGDGTQVTTHERNVRSAHHPTATATESPRRSAPAARRSAIDPRHGTETTIFDFLDGA